MNIVCPQCQKDDAIQKVSAVVTGGRASGSFSGYSGGAVNIDGKWSNTSSFTTLGGTSASDLARTLAPPPEITKQLAQASSPTMLLLLLSALGLTCACTILVWGTLIWFAMITKFELAYLVLAFLITCFFSWFFWILLRKSVREKAEAAKKIESKYAIEKLSRENAMIKWNRLYYCHRNGIVFDPENNKTCQPAQIREFVYE